MPTKTERILTSLPSTFRARPRPATLFALTDAFGGELQGAENSLAAVMQSHWVDHADRFAAIMADLPAFAALYGLAPRDDEDVEAFRAHLKRYVRTFLQGTVTVQGLLRICADALGLEIADDELDVWWRRPHDAITITRARLDDAATLVFGAAPLSARGSDPLPAAVRGPDLGAGVDVRAAGRLLVAVDGEAATEVDLTGVPDAAAAKPTELAAIIAAAVPSIEATVQGGRLRLASRTIGSASRLDVGEIDGDTAPAILGLPARRARGRAPRAARIVGRADLTDGVELDPERYVRIRIDRATEAEIDLRAGGAAHASLAQLCERINVALGLDVAGPAGAAIVLTSPTAGAASAVELLAPAAQDATALLFAGAPRFASGDDARPARIIGPDVSAGLDLRGGARVAVVVDGDEETVDCAGADPAATRPREIVERLNAALGVTAAGYDGHAISLSSTAAGPAGEVVIQLLETGDASAAIFGLRPRSFAGAHAVDARLEGPSDPLDLRARHVLRVAIDGGPWRDVDLRTHAAVAGAATPAELAAALDDAFGAEVAHVRDGQLELASPSAGAAGRVTAAPLAEVELRRFVSRAIVRGDAPERLLGTLRAEASGTPATSAAIHGAVDLGGSVDLRESGWLAIAIDGGAAQEVLVAGRRPRATTLAEVVAAIDGAFGQDTARANGGRLSLVSPTAGSASRVTLTPPAPEDALAAAGLAPGTVRGRDGDQVSLLGTRDLAGGADLSGGGALRLRVDGTEHEVDCAGADPAHTTIHEIVGAVNAAFGTLVALIEGSRIRLRSLEQASASTLDLLEPAAGGDAAEEILGVAVPRSYRGAEPQPARRLGAASLAGGLGSRRFLRVTVDGHPAVSVDLRAGAADPANPSLEEAVAALNAALGPGVASRDGDRLALTSPTAGIGSRLTLERHPSLDARVALLADAPADASGSDAAPATITGTVDLLAPVDLSASGTLVLDLGDGPPVELDVRGTAPATTFADEVVAAINARLPGLASMTDDDRLRLRWTGERLAVLPSRTIELIEYPPAVATEPPARLRHGDAWTIVDHGAASAVADIELLALRGIAAPAIRNEAAAVTLRMLTAIEAGGTLRLRVLTDGTLEVRATHPGGATELLAPAAILVQPDAEPASALKIPLGRSRWSYLECLGTRYELAHFDIDRFSGGPCTELGVFDASRWGETPDALVQAVYADPGAEREPSVEATVRWTRHAAGSLAVNLPAELPAAFGARFDTGRFGSAEGEGERYPDAVTEPRGADDDLAVRLHERSRLVDGEHVETLPLGWAAVTLPLRRPQPLTIGAPGAKAALYVREPDVPGFIRIEAREFGAQATAIAVTALRSGPASFDVTIAFEAGRYESARAAVAGRPLSASAEVLARPGAIGVLEAKAAGIAATIRRDRTPAVSPEHDE